MWLTVCVLFCRTCGRAVIFHIHTVHTLTTAPTIHSIHYPFTVHTLTPTVNQTTLKTTSHTNNWLITCMANYCVYKNFFIILPIDDTRDDTVQVSSMSYHRYCRFTTLVNSNIYIWSYRLLSRGLYYKHRWWPLNGKPQFMNMATLSEDGDILQWLNVELSFSTVLIVLAGSVVWAFILVSWAACMNLECDYHIKFVYISSLSCIFSYGWQHSEIPLYKGQSLKGSSLILYRARLIHSHWQLKLHPLSILAWSLRHTKNRTDVRAVKDI